ncbi:hypothetical protein [Sporosarcina sp. FA15]|uniref:hypothetical protein n=1 Tax=Sporosarcina sp. FA15 TaxID=3413031 RepID=UPI003F65AE1A
MKAMALFAIDSKLKRFDGLGAGTSQYRKAKGLDKQSPGCQLLTPKVMNDNPPDLERKPFSAINSKQMKIKEFDVYVDQENHIIPT